MKIIINQGKIGTRPIAIVPFHRKNVKLNLEQIIKNDLLLSGIFNPLRTEILPTTPNTFAKIDLSKWRPLVESMVVGSLEKIDNKINLKVELIDVHRQTKLLTLSYQLKSKAPKYIRKVGHKISDIIYQKLTGVRGIFATKLAYVTVKKLNSSKLYSLDISGVDGKDSVSVFKSYKSIMSPAWAPSGNKIAYVSFENDTAEIWVKDLLKNARKKVLRFKGSASSPSWSPDGDSLSVTLTQDGNAEIYVINLVKKTIMRVTNHKKVDTEAVWAPDGKGLYFLSDRSGQPQIYFRKITERKLGKIKMVTKHGSYNTSPDIAADNSNLAILHRSGGKYKVATYNLTSGKIKILSQTNYDEAPSFSPNSEMIVYASKVRRRGVITIVNKLGTVHQYYSLGNVDVREPAWSPFLD